MPQQTRSRKQTAVSSPPPSSEIAEIPADEARAALGELLDRAGWRGERIAITRHGKPIAALVSIDDLKRLEAVA